MLLATIAVFLSMLPKDEPFYKVSMLTLKAETNRPVTMLNIWEQGRDVTATLQSRRRAIMALLGSGKKGHFTENAVRLGISTISGHKAYVDKFGGVRMTGGDRRLNRGQLRSLERLLPSLRVVPKPGTNLRATPILGP